MTRVVPLPSARPRSISVALIGVLLIAAGCSSPAAAPTAAPTAAPKPAATAAPAAQPSASPAAVAGSPAASPVAVASASPAALPAASPAAVVPSPSPVAAATATPGGPLTHLTVAFSERIANNLPLWYGVENGIFQKHGLEVDPQLIASSNSVAALVAGQVQFTMGGGAEALSAVAGGANLTVVGTTCAVYPFVFEVPADIGTINDLKGKKVGVSNIGSSSDIATRAGLRKEGLDPDKDVEIVAVGSLQNRTAALLSGAIQGGVAQPPDQLALEAKGFHALFDLAALKLPSSQNSIIAQSSYVASNRDVVQRYIDAITEAIAKEKTDKAGAIKVLQKYLQNDDQTALAVTYDFFVGETIPSDPIPTPDQFQDDFTQLSARNPAVKNVDINKMLDTSFAESAINRGLDKP